MISPFRALRYDDPNSADDGVLEVDTVIAPVAAVDDPELRLHLSQRSAYNIANALGDALALEQWEAAGWLHHDEAAALYLYRIGFTQTDGKPAQWSGVFARTAGHQEGADRQIVPRLVTVRAEGFSELLSPVGLVPLCRATDDGGAHHRVWAIEQPGVIDLVTSAVNQYGDPVPADLAPGTLILAGESELPATQLVLGLVLA